MVSVAPKLVERFTLRARVTGVEHIRPRFRLIRLAGPELAKLRWTPGQHVRVLVSGPVDGIGSLARIVLRSYSIWACGADWIELCVYEHGEGPGAAWASSLGVGDEVTFRPPEGRLVLDHAAPYHLFVGEDTAAVAFGAMLEALAQNPEAAEAHAVLEAEGETSRLPLPTLPGGAAAPYWIDRGDASAAAPERLVAALRAYPLPETPGVAYVAGEARACQAVRAHLVAERGWPRRAVLLKPFWTPGRRGME